jgi:hypothetical protein
MKMIGRLVLAAFLAIGLAQAQTAAPMANFRNILIGGDFTTNPYQLGTTAVTGITTTGTFHADRWFAYTSASSAYLTRITSGVPIGFGAAEQLARTAANANTSAICMVQIIEQNEAIALQGQPMILSYDAAPAANFSGTGVQAVITTSTAAAGTRAALIAGTWTNQSNIGGLPLQAISATTGNYGRYQLAFNMPLGALSAAVQLCFNGVGTAGTVDGVIFAGIQLEIAQQPIVPGPTGLATPFERRFPGVELHEALRYLYVIPDAAATASLPCVGVALTANTTVDLTCSFPVPMVQVPTFTESGTPFGITQTAGTQAACSGIAAVASGATTQSAGIACTTAGTIAQGGASVLRGNATSGYIAFSAEY